MSHGSALLILLLLPAGCAAAAEAPWPAPGDHERRLEHGGRTRHYTVHVPPGLPVEGAGGAPLLLAFHGGGGNASGFRAYAGLDALADREGFVVVYPDGTGPLGRRLLTWNAGACCGYARKHGVDDVGFALAVLDSVTRALPIDAARVYATGHSNGAMISYRLAAEAADRIAAIAAVAGSPPLDAFAPARPVAVLHIHSVDDPRALYAGGLGPRFPLTNHRALHGSVEAQLARWAQRDGCPAEPRVAERRGAPQQGSAAGHTATLLVFGPCESGFEVAHWRLTGAGHGWPGGRIRLLERIMGPDTEVIDAASESWRFLRRFSRR